MNITDRLSRAGRLAPVRQDHWFGTVALPGEPTDDPALRITPDVHIESDPADRGYRMRYTGHWRLVHVHTGCEITAGRRLPLPWLRRFARLLATSGIDWCRLTGDTMRPAHPKYAVVARIGEHVLDCHHRGVPVDDRLLSSLVDDGQRYALSCANPHCEDEFTRPDPAVLACAGDDGRDELWVTKDDLDELYDAARTCGWRRLDEHHWLCETCTATHQPTHHA